VARLTRAVLSRQALPLIALVRITFPLRPAVRTASHPNMKLLFVKAQFGTVATYRKTPCQRAEGRALVKMPGQRLAPLPIATYRISSWASRICTLHWLLLGSLLPFCAWSRALVVAHVGNP